MYHVVEQVLQVVKENKVTKVDALVLQVGETSSVIPRYLQACYPATVDGTMLEGTRLEIEVLPANGFCKGCGKVFGLLEHKNTCPHCGGRVFEQLSGNEFYIKEIVAC
jgi:hydrogenase nickel incorporation protein HypA/HybF